MKHNKIYLLPKLAGLTVILGIGSVLLFVLFKLMVVVLGVALVVFAVKSAMMMIDQFKSRMEQADDDDELISLETAFPAHHYNARNRQLAIIPIN